MGIHIAASKCPHVHAAVVESVPAALRCITGNNCNVLAMGAFYVAPQMGIEIAEAFLSHNLGDGYEWWHNFYDFHKLAYDELEAFDYEEFKQNGFELKHLDVYKRQVKTCNRSAALNQYVPELTSVICFCSSVASFCSTIPVSYTHLFSMGNANPCVRQILLQLGRTTLDGFYPVVNIINLSIPS